MLPRERVLSALNLRVPDRVPKALSFYPVSFDGMNDEDIAGRLGADVRFVEFEASKDVAEFEHYLESLPMGVEIGNPSILRTYSEWQYRPDMAGDGPLSAVRDQESLGGYRLPDLTAPYRSADLDRKVETFKRLGYAVAGLPPHLGGEVFESAWRLRGFPQFMLDLATGQPFADYLLDQLVALAIENARVLATAGVDILVLDDDIGMPTTMIISPDMWREFLKPRLAGIIQAAREISPGIKVLYHSDGYIEPVIADLIDVGVGALNPIQPDRMDVARIKRDFGEHVAIWGGIGTHNLMASGSPEQIRAEVRRRIATLSYGGGYVACPAYDVDYGVPWDNLETFARAVDEYGAYE